MRTLPLSVTNRRRPTERTAMKRRLGVVVFGAAAILAVTAAAWAYLTLFTVPPDVLNGRSGGSRSRTPASELMRQYQSGRGVLATGEGQR